MTSALTYDTLFQHNLKQLDTLQQSVDKANIDLEHINQLPVAISESNINAYDLGFAIIAGVIGGAISSSEKISEFMSNIHDHSHNPDSLAGKIFHHVGDYMDKPFGGKFTTRSGGSPEVPFHRVFFGHDIFSVQSDNPFLLLIKQYGILKGPFQAVRHLIADTFSKQGLPLPGHSFLDFTKSNGGTGNYLVELTKKLTRNAREAHKANGSNVNVVSHGEAFNHLFTIRMQDIVSQGLTWGLCEAYLKIGKVKDKIRQSQIKIIAYSVSFVNCFVGMSKTGGIPYINWPTLTILVKEMFQFFRLNWRDIKELEKVTNQIVEENKQLENRVFAAGVDLPSYDNGYAYINELKKQDEKYQDLVDFFEED